MGGNLIKVIGLAATAVGIGVNLINDWVAEKKMGERIEEKINEVLAERENKENEEDDENEEEL